MPKRVLLWAMVFFAFANVGCREKEQQDFPSLPSLHITMSSLQWDSIMIDQDNKVSTQALLMDAQGDTLFKGTLAHIKTRGNSSFNEPKKSFTIKFKEKQSWFGLKSSRSFVLIANAYDESQIRNAIGLDIARASGIPSPRYAYLTLYINDTFKGLYQITNKVDEGKDVVSITNLNQQNKLANSQPLEKYQWYGNGRNKQVIQRKGVLLDRNPDDITGGYILDNTGPPHYYSKSISGFVSDAGDNIRIRAPKYASRQEVDYIAKRYNEMERAILAADGIHPETGKHYSEYIDLRSFARYFLLNEVLSNPDGDWTSFLMYKDTDDIDPKIYAGPAWDYDRILDNPMFSGSAGFLCNELYVDRKKGKTGWAHSGGLLYHLCRHHDFQQEVRNCYMNEISPACHSYLDERPFDSLATLIAHAAEQDNLVYRTRRSKDYETAMHRATDFLRKKVEFMDWYYSSAEDERVVVTYTINGKKHTLYYPLGETIEAPQLEVVYNHTPINELYYAGTDSIVPEGTVFLSRQELELRQREPTNREVQLRRIRKKLTKWGILKR